MPHLWISDCSSTVCWIVYSSFIELLYFFTKNHLGIFVYVYFWVPYFFSLIYESIFLPVNSDSTQIYSSPLFFVKIVLALLGLVSFHINLRIAWLSMSTRKSYWNIFIESALYLGTHQFGKNWHLYILSILFHEHTMSLQLFSLDFFHQHLIIVTIQTQYMFCELYTKVSPYLQWLQMLLILTYYLHFGLCIFIVTV